MNRMTALLDANVLYPAGLRDFLLRLADQYLYRPLWTAARLYDSVAPRAVVLANCPTYAIQTIQEQTSY